MYLLALLGPFTDHTDRFPYPLLYFTLRNPYPFIYLKPEKGTPLGGASPSRPLLSPPPGSLGLLLFEGIQEMVITHKNVGNWETAHLPLP